MSERPADSLVWTEETDLNLRGRFGIHLHSPGRYMNKFTHGLDAEEKKYAEGRDRK